MSEKPQDPFYARKPVPKEFIEHVGYTGLSGSEEFENRERKYSVGGTAGDLRKFSNPKYGGKLDPFYQRKPVPDSMIQGVAETGLTKEEEYLNRERKYSVNGVDVRKFTESAKTGWHPTDDPYYGRKSVAKPSIIGVGETQMTKAEEFETRENKAALFDLSSDPFAQLTGSGHRASISGAAGPAAAAAARRRSSAVAPDLDHQHEHHHPAHHHSGYDGDKKLGAISDQVNGDEIRPSTEGPGGTTYTGPTTTTTTTTTTSTNVVGGDKSHDIAGSNGHTTFYDAATKDLDNVGPRGER